MSELTREQIEAQKRYMPSLERLCDMALRTHDAEQRAEQAEAERDEYRDHLAEMEGSVSVLAQERDEARQEAARLRNKHYWYHVQNTAMAAARALSQPAPAVPERMAQLTLDMREAADTFHHCGNEACGAALRSWAQTIDRVAATHPADGDSPAVPDAVRRMPKQWRHSAEAIKRNDWPSADARHFQLYECSYELECALATHPADSDSSAVPDGYVLISKDRYECIQRGIELLEQSATPFDEGCSLIRGAVSEAPAAAPAVPDRRECIDAEEAVRRLHSAASRFGHHLHNQQEDMDRDKERAVACIRALVQPSDSPAVPDGYVLVPKEPTPNMLRTGEEARMEMSYRTTFPKARAVYEAMIAAAPTPTDDGGNK